MFDAALSFARDGLLVCVLAALATVDIRRGVLPNAIVLPAGVAGLLLSVATDFGRWWAYPAGVAGVGGSLLVLAAAYPGGLGMGDVKMGGMLGAFLGPQAFVAVFLGAVLGTLVAGVLLGLGRIGRRTPLPFGAFLAAGGMVTLLWGGDVFDWYLVLAQW